MGRVDSLEKTLMLGRNGGRRRRTTEDEMAGWHHQLHGHELEWTPGVGDGQGGLVLQFMGSQRVGHDWVTELNWTELYGRASLFHSFTQLLIYISVDLYVFGLLTHSNTLPFFSCLNYFSFGYWEPLQVSFNLIIASHHYFLKTSHFLTAKIVADSYGFALLQYWNQSLLQRVLVPWIGE